MVSRGENVFTHERKGTQASKRPSRGWDLERAEVDGRQSLVRDGPTHDPATNKLPTNPKGRPTEWV